MNDLMLMKLSKKQVDPMTISFILNSECFFNVLYLLLRIEQQHVSK